jgi:phospholipid/cholesterol/gamma-HCH transport system substrate-binding protein
VSALFRRPAGGGRRRGRLSAFQAGVIALVVITFGSYAVWTRFNPFANPFTLYANFEQVSNLGTRSPVRIAGVEVGKVVQVEPRDGGGARVKMELQERALPIHRDAELKVHPRIFLEGNFFVDLQPGTPAAPTVGDGDTIPARQTQAPVQLGDVLSALQSDTRADLQTLVKELAKGYERGGAEGLNRTAPYLAPAYRDLAIASDAALGERPTEDVQRVLRGTRRTVEALNADPAALKGLVTNFNATAGALAQEDVALAASVPALRDTLRAGLPALASLNRTLPPLRMLAREALPGVRRLGPLLTDSLPFLREARALVGPAELRATARALRVSLPSLNRLLEVSPALFAQGRAASRCTARVLVPFITSDFPDPDFHGNTGTVNQKLQRSFVGLAGESRVNDANQSYFHTSAVPPPMQVRPAPPSETTVPPTHRPDKPCENQEPPNLKAPGATIQPGGGLAPLASPRRLVSGPSLATRRAALLRAKPAFDRWFKKILLKQQEIMAKERPPAAREQRP